MEAESTFTRRICAVLLADVTGFSKLTGENDERTARAVHHLQSIAQGIVGEHNGRAEPVAGDALFAPSTASSRRCRRRWIATRQSLVLSEAVRVNVLEACDRWPITSTTEILSATFQPRMPATK